jgi:hypothetical protein
MSPLHHAVRAAVAAAAIVLLVAAAPTAPAAVTLNAPLEGGDRFIVLNALNGFSQIRNGARVGASVTFGANDRLGGVASDSTGIYFAGNPDGAALTVERIGLGQTTSTQLLNATDLAGGGATPVIRDVGVSPAGILFVLYGTGAVDKFTPAGGGAYTRAPLGTFTGFTSADRGSGHQLSVSNDGNFLVTSSRSQNRVWSMNTSTGADQQYNVPAGLLGPVTNTQLTLSATSVLDPVRGDRVLVPMSNDGLYEVDFDPATGAFAAGNPRRLSNDTVAAFVDAVGFDNAGNLHVSLRDSGSIGSLREFTPAEIDAASDGITPFSIFAKSPSYTNADARIARDLAVTVPEPATLGLVSLAAIGLLHRRRRRRAD